MGYVNDIRAFNDIGTDRVIRGESVASQLPGREVGPADAYRHILLAAELTRLYGTGIAMRELVWHEAERDGGIDNGLDFWNDEIGIGIAQHVVASGGGWRDVVRLAREAVARSFESPADEETGREPTYNEIVRAWDIKRADEGLERAYDRYRSILIANLLDGVSDGSFNEFADTFNREYQFRVRPGGTVTLDGGALTVPAIALTSPENWQGNPVANGRRLANEESAFPDQEWTAGRGFHYEVGNGSMRYFEAIYGPFYDGPNESNRTMDLTVPSMAPPHRATASPATANAYQNAIEAARIAQQNEAGSRVNRRSISAEWPRHDNLTSSLPASVLDRAARDEPAGMPGSIDDRADLGGSVRQGSSVATALSVPLRLILPLSRIGFSAMGASRTMDLGWAAHADHDGAAVAADPNGLDAAVDVSSAGSVNPSGTVGGGETMLFEAQAGLVLTAQVNGGTFPNGATLKGWFVYVVD